MSQATIFRFATVAMALGVILGAFGAHALKARLTPEDLAIWQTGVQYHLLHGVALVAIAAAWPMLAGATTIWGVRLIMIGMVVFSMSLYLLVLTGPRWLGAITPFGGVMMISGWLLLAVSSIGNFRGV